MFTLLSCNKEDIISNQLSSNIDDSSFSNDLIVTDANEPSDFSSMESSEETSSEEVAQKTRLIEVETKDSVIYEVEHAYYDENGGLVVEGYIENITEDKAYVVRCRKLELYNEDDELIASNAFGYVRESYSTISVNVGEPFERSFVFPAVSVRIKDDDLDSYKIVSSFTSKHLEKR